MTDQELKDLVASLPEAQKKMDEQLKKTDETIEKLSQMYGGASNNQGKVVEEFFFNFSSTNLCLAVFVLTTSTKISLEAKAISKKSMILF